MLDEEVVGVMADHYGLTRQAQAEQLLAWQYDTLTATYFLLLARRQAGKQFRILQPNPDLKPLPDLIADKVTLRKQYRHLFYFYVHLWRLLLRSLFIYKAVGLGIFCNFSLIKIKYWKNYRTATRMNRSQKSW